LLEVEAVVDGLMLREAMEEDLQETTEQIAQIQVERKFQVVQLRTTVARVGLPREP
jgi:hypothetical protein